MATSQTRCQHLKPNRDISKLAPTFRNRPQILYIYIIVAVAVFNNKFNNLQGTLGPSLGHEAGQGLGLGLEFW